MFYMSVCLYMQHSLVDLEANVRLLHHWTCVLSWWFSDLSCPLGSLWFFNQSLDSVFYTKYLRWNKLINCVFYLLAFIILGKQWIITTQKIHNLTWSLCIYTDFLQHIHSYQNHLLMKYFPSWYNSSSEGRKKVLKEKFTFAFAKNINDLYTHENYSY